MPLLGLLALLAWSGCGSGGGNGDGAASQDPKPRLAAFQPASGFPGDPILITGSRLQDTVAVSFGGVPAPLFKHQGDSKLYALVPPEAVSGRIQVTNPAGSSESGQAFTIRHQPPTLLLLSPSQGQPGTRVLLTGTNFTPDLKVRFAGIEAQVVRESLTRATATVPAGFSHGQVDLATAAGRVSAPEAFQIVPAPADLKLSLAAVMLTQGSQTFHQSVPLVANRNAFLAVAVVADRANHAVPMVRVHIQDLHRTDLLTEDIPAPAAQVPQAADPAALDSLWTLPVAGKYLQWSNRILLELFPDAGGHGAPIATWPANGVPWRMEARDVPTLRVTLVPVVLADGALPDVDDPPRQLEDWIDRFQAMFPVAKVEVVKRPAPLHCNLALRADDLASWDAVLTRLEQLRIADGNGPSQFYFGVVKPTYAEGIAGIGSVHGSPFLNVGRSALGWDRDGAVPGDNRDFRMVFAHEMGHTLGREHAPCGPPDYPIDQPDPHYPYPKADIGVFGCDVTARSLKAPGSFKDIMSYAPPGWISDYTYEGVLTFLTGLHFMEKYGSSARP